MSTVIAVFDDNKVDRFIYRQLFNLYTDQPEVHIFSNAEEGIKAAAEVGFDMAYIDMHFWQRFGGTSILKSLRKLIGDKLIAVAMSSLLQAGDFERMIDAGFDLCLDKADFFRGLDLMQLS